MSNETVTLAVLDDGDCTTYSLDAIVIEVPKADYDADVFENGKECAKYVADGVSAAKAVDCVRRIVEVLYPGGDTEHEWDGETIEWVATHIRACGFEPKGNG